VVLGAETLVFEGKEGPGKGKRIVLVSGDEEYRSEESMPMLGKILSQHHGFHCTVVFSWDKEGKFIDSNNQQGLYGLKALNEADLMIIATRFRQPNAEEAPHVTAFLNAGKPVMGLRTATHAFNGKGSFGDTLSFGKFGREILGEEWVSHHGGHKSEGALGVVEKAQAEHAILRGVKDVFGPSDIYGVVHLTDADTILMRGAVTETLDPKSKPVAGKKNEPKQPLAWLHPFTAPNGTTKGISFCTTMGASVDLVNEGLRRLIVNAAYHLTKLEVPASAKVDYVDPFYPSFYGFINEPNYWKDADLQAEDFGMGKTPSMPDPKGSPEWLFRPTK
jgi:type 1 glutamine amidotransferase